MQLRNHQPLPMRSVCAGTATEASGGTDARPAVRKARPILFSAPMVRAILEGRKTQTRRAVSFEPSSFHFPHTVFKHCRKHSGGGWIFTDAEIRPEDWKAYEFDAHGKLCPYGNVGSRLRVCESHQLSEFKDQSRWVECWYHADDVTRDVRLTESEWAKFKARKKPYAKLSGRYMLASLSRITLELTDIRVERVQDISEEDAVAEGLGVSLCADVFNNAAKNVPHYYSRWLRGDPACADYCVRCVEKIAKKRGFSEDDIDGWDDYHESDGPPFCDACGGVINLSLTVDGINSQLFFTEENGGLNDRFRWPARGADARILSTIAGGIGDLREKHRGRLAQIGFATLWESINGKGSWASNPWVWVVAFKRVEVGNG